MVCDQVVAAAAELRAAEADLAALAQAGATQAEIDIATTAVQERRADHTAAVSAARAALADAGGSEVTRPLTPPCPTLKIPQPAQMPRPARFQAPVQNTKTN